MMNLNLRFFVGINYISHASLNRNKYFFSVKLLLLRHTRLPSALTLMGESWRGRRFERGRRPATKRLQARTQLPPGCLQRPGKGCRHVQGGGNVRVFTFAVLPAQSTQVPVIEKNMTLDFG